MTEELKEQTLTHWRDNLHRLKAMDWKEWMTHSRWDKDAAVQGGGLSTPQIFGNACPLCAEYFHTTCGNCPLARSPRSNQCCEEWRTAYKALVCSKYKKDVIAAFKAMIKRIEEIVV